MHSPPLGPPVRSRRYIQLITCASCVVGSVCGCADSQIKTSATSETPVEATAAIDLAPKERAADAEVEVTPTAVVAGRDDATHSVNPADASSEPYTPPFPDRVDLFLAPKRQGNSGHANDSSERAVELMGFIRVDRPRAILSINGQVSSIAEGETVDGIEVISVQPPSVLLQRGRQRWQATIE